MKNSSSVQQRNSMIPLDTHAVLWLAEVPERLSPEARRAISAARANDGLAIADKTLWEIAHLVSLGRVELQSSVQEFLGAVEQYFVVLPITAAVAERSVLFTRSYPKDSTDRIIGATALANAIELVTADRLIRKSGEVPCIW